MADEQDQLAADVGEYHDDPLGWVMYAFPWDSDDSIQIAELQEPYASKYGSKYGPDLWACELLDEWGMHIKEQGFDGKKAVAAFQSAVSSGHGIGKSALTSWVVLFIMSTRPYCKGTVTANTSDQLRTKTWGELGKWKRKCVTGDWFEYNNGKGNMNLYHKDHQETWRCDGITCREENSEAFAGLHAASSTPFYIFDEASAVPDKIWEVAEGGLTDGEPFWLVFGNPTRSTGRFRECFRRFRHRWTTRHIDSRNVQITNKQKINEWVEDHGEDSDFVKVRVRGVFPSQSIKQFISEDLVEAARGRHLSSPMYSFAPKILSVDPAWDGDDNFVIGLRQGLNFQILRVLPKNDDDVAAANLIASLEDEHDCDAVFIDFGYGTGIYSVGQSLGRDWLLVQFGGSPKDPGFLNKRAEMYNDGKKWLQAGGSLPDEDRLCGDLTAVETVPRVDGKVQLESKKDMKKRMLPSPDYADCFIISFAFDVQPRMRELHKGETDMCDMGD